MSTFLCTVGSHAEFARRLAAGHPLRPRETEHFLNLSAESMMDGGVFPHRAAWPVDGHVHLHRLELVPDLLDAAARHFQLAAPAQGKLLGGLLLTQASWEQVFENLERRERIGQWSLRPAIAESETLIATSGLGSLAIVCGRQVRVDNGIEVSALGTREVFADRQPLDATVAAIKRSGALMMIPWGLGKWMGSRGRMVAKVMQVQEEEFYMGDSGCRLGWLPPPKLVRAARVAGRGVMAGTDPFPFCGDHRRVGSFGFYAHIEPSIDAPWRGLRAWLAQRTAPLQFYGAPTGPVRFLINQLGIHVHGRLRNKAA